jgi:hypothetical protein
MKATKKNLSNVVEALEIMGVYEGVRADAKAREILAGSKTLVEAIMTATVAL